MGADGSPAPNSATTPSTATLRTRQLFEAQCSAENAVSPGNSAGTATTPPIAPNKKARFDDDYIDPEADFREESTNAFIGKLKYYSFSAGKNIFRGGKGRKYLFTPSSREISRKVKNTHIPGSFSSDSSLLFLYLYYV